MSFDNLKEFKFDNLKEFKGFHVCVGKIQAKNILKSW